MACGEWKIEHGELGMGNGKGRRVTQPSQVFKTSEVSQALQLTINN
jgi:hypothetical protein